MRNRILVLGLLALLLAGSPAAGLEVGGVALPDSLTAGGDTLVLNGGGLRKKLFIKVYAGGLYLPEKSGDPDAVIAADRPMAIRMHFIYDGVSPEKLVEAWNEGFTNATGGNTAPIQEKIDRFNGFFREEAKKGDVYDVVYLPGEGITVTVKGEARGTIPGLEFKQAVFAIWLGEKPADKGLKEGMLGK